MLIILVRTLVLYFSVIVIMRIMGKQQIGQLQPFELVIALMISELAAIPMENTGIPLINGLTPILTLTVAQLVLSYLSLKSERARALICGKPSVLIERGKIIEKELQDARYNLSDLLEELRVKNVPNIADVEFAILETNGNLSVIPKSQKRPLTPDDLNISTHCEGLPNILISDGHVVHHTLRTLNLQIDWLLEQLNARGIDSPKQVFLASLDTRGNLYLQKKTTS